VRTAVHATHRDVRLLKLDEPFTFPLDLIWRDGTGTLRPALAAVLATALEVRFEQAWSSSADPSATDRYVPGSPAEL
jgi:hypothetical protein